MAKSRKKSPPRLVILVVVLVIAAVTGILVYHYHSNAKTRNNLAVTSPKTIIKASTSTPTSPALPNANNLTPGGAIDKNGQTSTPIPSSSDWVSSASGVITLQQPSANSMLTSGDTISGTASVANVSFILTDNSMGLIDQGSLSVVSGHFSGLMEFQAHSKSGKLEVYYPNPSNGGEEDVVEINVNFST